MNPNTDILLVIDTGSVIASCPKPSLNPIIPAVIDGASASLLTTATRPEPAGVSGNGKAPGIAGHTVRVFAISDSDGFENSVLVYGVSRLRKGPWFGAFQYRDPTRSAVAPHSAKEPLPARIVEKGFGFCEARSAPRRQETYAVRFALYTRDPKSGHPKLYGYFEWEPADKSAEKG